MPTFISTTITSTGYGNLLLPGYVRKVIIEAWGAGGGGGSYSGVNLSGGGGGGGAYSRANLYVNGGERIFYFVGTGGGARLNFAGNAGLASWVTLSGNNQPNVISSSGPGAGVYANGGGGGAGSAITRGTSGSIWIYGDAEFAGGFGGNGIASGSPRGGGGGGGGAGSGGDGSNGDNGNAAVTGGRGGTGGSAGTFTFLNEVSLADGAGATGGNGVTTGNAVAAASPGAGGGAGFNATPSTGGNGGNGQIRISYLPAWDRKTL